MNQNIYKNIFVYNVDTENLNSDIIRFLYKRGSLEDLITPEMGKVISDPDNLITLGRNNLINKIVDGIKDEYLKSIDGLIGSVGEFFFYSKKPHTDANLEINYEQYYIGAFDYLFYFDGKFIFTNKKGGYCNTNIHSNSEVKKLALMMNRSIKIDKLIYRVS